MKPKFNSLKKSMKLTNLNLGIEENSYNLIKGICEKFTVIILNVRYFTPIIRNKVRMSTLPISIKHFTGSLSQDKWGGKKEEEGRGGKGRRKHPSCKEKQLSLDDMIS